MVKDETAYSTPCKVVNIRAKITVYINPYKVSALLPFIKE
jgi:hypothetical protein